VQHQAKRCPLSLWLLQWGKRTWWGVREKTTPAFQHWVCFVGATTLILHDGDCRGIFRINHWESDCDREGGRGEQEDGTYNNQHVGLGKWGSYPKYPVVIPTTGFAHLQNQVGGSL